MSVDIIVPALGESVASATVARWMKQPGDAVAADEALVELETDKVSVEINAPAGGVMGAILAAEGAEVEVGNVLATIEESRGRATGNLPAAPAAVAAPATKGAVADLPEAGITSPAPARGPVARPASASPSAAHTPLPAAAHAPSPAAAHTPSPAAAHAPLPAAAKMLTERGVAPDALGDGTGKDGRITKGDVLEFLARPAPAAAAPAAVRAPRPPDAREERVKMTRLRRTIAARLKEAQNNAAMLTTFNEVDMSAIMALRNEYKDAFEKKNGGVRLGFMSVFVRACVAALAEFPAVNAEIDGDEIVYKNFVHMGIAVGGPSGLVVPVIRDADQMSFAQIERAIGDFGKRARDGQLKLEELAGGTFSITNGGVYGSLMSTPILNPPQSGILGMHKIQERPVAVGGKVEIRPMMYLALSYDHRIVDGKEAVSFLVRVKESVEDPRRMLLGI
jgi:2-oxoglutarate dehydrogenase E2 component (dihydrolipoamide succinyltransferase)